MNTDVEQLVREGLDRITAGARVPAGLVSRARRRVRRRRLAVGSAAVSGAAAVTAAAVIAAGAAGPGGQAGTAVHVQTAAYVVLRHVQREVASQHRVMFGWSVSRGTGEKAPTFSATWSYRAANRFMEYSSPGRPYLADGTAEIGGRLRAAYVTYFDRKWSGGGPLTPAAPACSKTARLEMGGPPPVTTDWPAFIGSALGCGAATVTGRARIDGVDTIKITGTPVRDRLPKGMVQATRAEIRFTLYVNPRTYLPVRLDDSTTSYGGGARPFTYATVTGFRWLPPTAANVARAIVTIPPGFRHVKSAADQ